MPRQVRAYHGTTHSIAIDIINHRRSFVASDNPGDWLGRGVYFFEENLVKAIEWAFVQVGLRGRLGVIETAAVLVADLDLSDCLDLCSSQWHDHLLVIGKKLHGARQLPQQHGPVLGSGAGQWFTIADYTVPPYAAATVAAENGATAHELMAIFGWLSLKEAERYTRGAERAKLAERGMGLLVALKTRT
jgi:hypothetical protein